MFVDKCTMSNLVSVFPYALRHQIRENRIRSELNRFEIRIQKKLYCLYRSRTNYIRLNNLRIKKTYEGRIICQ